MSALPAADLHDDPPNGYVLVPSSGFTGHCRLYSNAERGMLGARVRPEHLNPLNIAHGGFLATLADTAFGRAMLNATGAARPSPTVTLSLDYLSPAPLGSWIEAHTEVHKVGRTISHASLELRDGERVIARGKAIFMTPRHD